MRFDQRRITYVAGYCLRTGFSGKFAISSFAQFITPLATTRQAYSITTTVRLAAQADVARTINNLASYSTTSHQFQSRVGMANEEERKNGFVDNRELASSRYNIPQSPTRKRELNTENTPFRRREIPIQERTGNRHFPSTQQLQSPPPGWEEIYSLVEELRQDRTAPCDGSGGEALADQTLSPPEYRAQVLLCLIICNQVSKQDSAEAIRAMQRDKNLSVEALSTLPLLILENYFSELRYSKMKAETVKQVATILKEKYYGDIPPTAELIMRLPSVGPKLAYICETVAWNKQTGVWVSTDMDQLFNRLGWINTNNRAQTRIQVEAWLPRDKWADANVLWVGFARELEQSRPKLLRKALGCSRPADALRLLKRCGLDYAREARKQGLEDEVKNAIAKGRPNDDLSTRW